MKSPKASSLSAAALICLGACVQTPAPVAEPSPSPVCPNHSAVVSDEGLWSKDRLAADVDADGRDDDIALAVDESGPQGCQVFVVVRTSAAVAAVGIDQAGMTVLRAAGIPRLAQAADIDNRSGAEVVVDLIAGASTVHAAIFSMGSGVLERLLIEGDGPETADLFPYGGSVGHIEASDCAGVGQIVVSRAVPRGRNSYLVTRRFYRTEGSSAEPSGEEQHGVAAGQIDKFPEYRTSPFGSCPLN
ncbi:MAG TPA: hypothetical protein VHJ82_02975 [Actinomycetota bacterium]|nr:hypothetical protein [Actinomycetota bacterium]